MGTISDLAQLNHGPYWELLSAVIVLLTYLFWFCCRFSQFDDEVDVLYDRVYRDLIDIMVRDPSTVEACTRLLWVAHNLERVGDRLVSKLADARDLDPAA